MKTIVRSLLTSALLVLAAAPMQAELMYATNGFSIVRFDSATPGSVMSSVITGMGANEFIVGIDLRPATGTVYGIGSSSRLYTINPLTGVATPVGSAGAFTLSGNQFGVDFNPTVDRIRLVSDTEQSLRINPNDGSLAGTDSALTPAGNVVAAAYDRNDLNGATPTTLFGIDSAAGTLVRIGGPDGVPSPNLGAVTTIGSLGLGTNLAGTIGFDISGLTGVAYATVSGFFTSNAVDGVVATTRLYTINLANGQATLIGTVGGNSALAFSGLTAAAIPEPSTYALLGAGALLFLLRGRLRRVRS
ncbi:MAG TPA: DUF4394 domain-containing protein [Chthoniobacterales bacterium]